MDLQGVGIWALGYDDGYNELWGAIYDKFASSMIGDLNFDNQIDISDIILLVSIILEENNLYDEIADINSDGIINVIDVIYMVSIILD